MKTKMFRQTLSMAFLVALTANNVAVLAQDNPGGNKFPINQPTQPEQQPADSATAELEYGSIAIRAIQGTEGAAPIGVLPIQVDLVSNNTIIRTIDTSLDEFGVAVLTNLPVEQGIFPIVRIDYGDVKYQQFGTMMDANNAQQRIEMVCYETTETQPNLNTVLRQVMIIASGHGIKVTEIVVVNNPTTRTWIGSGTGKPGMDTRTTIQFTLPEQADNISMANGGRLGSATVESTSIINHMPLVPRESEFSYGYSIHSDPQGNINLVIPQNAKVDALMVVVPQSMKVGALTGLEFGGNNQIADTPVRYYQALDLLPGQSTAIALSGFEHSEGEAASAMGKTATPGANSSANSGSNNFKLIAGIGIAILVLGGIAFIIARAKSGGPMEDYSA